MQLWLVKVFRGPFCDECDTVWKDTDITEDNCDNFESILGGTRTY